MEKDFVGREESKKELIEAIDFSDATYQVISIVGPPGVGKSTLAIHVANEIAKHADVCYFKLDEFPKGEFRQAFTKMLIGTENSSMQSLREWARNQSDSILVVLDDCDMYINEQKENFLDTIKNTIHSKSVKFLTTSQKEFIFKEKICSHKLEPLNKEDAMKFLDLRSQPHDLTITEQKMIAELTECFPLALNLLGALFAAEQSSISPQEVINEINRTRFNFDYFDNMSYVISIAYNYLIVDLKEYGRHLAYFQGSFSKNAAHSVIEHLRNNSADKTKSLLATNELTMRSLLGYDRYSERYYFHRLIKNFFLLRSNFTEEQQFNFVFQKHFGKVLCEGAKDFPQEPYEAMSKLKEDRHNFVYLLSLVKNQPNISDSICLKDALAMGYLSSRLSLEELIGPVEAVTNFIGDQLSNTPADKFDETLATFVDYVYHLAQMTEALEGKVQAAWQYRNRVKLISTFAGSEYITFCSRLLDYESQLHFYDYRPCYKDKLSEKYVCNRKKAYFVDPEAEQYFKTFYYADLEGEQYSSSMKPRQSICQDSGRLQIGSRNSALISKQHEIEKHFEQFYFWLDSTRNEEVQVTLKELSSLASFLNGHSIAVVHHYKEIYYKFTEYMRRGITDCSQDRSAYHDHHMRAVKAVFYHFVDTSELVFESVIEIGSNSQIDVKWSSLVADGLFLTGNFSRAAKVASYAINFTSSEKIFYSVCSGIILSKSLYALGEKNKASLEFVRIMDVILSHNTTVAWKKEAFDEFLEVSCSYLSHLDDSLYLKKCSPHHKKQKSSTNELGKV